MDNLGYCCINLSVDSDVSVNRGMIKRTFQEKGVKYAGQLAEKNIDDLFKILKWNVDNDIRIYRMSSDMFPWMSEYEFEDLPNWNSISAKLNAIGRYIIRKGLRVGFHPGQYCVLPSPTPKVVDNTIRDLDQHCRILDAMGLPISPEYSLNIHVGGSYGDKKSAMARFCENFRRLHPNTQARLVVENDDKASQYSVIDLYEGIHQVIGIPITFDFFHHTFCTGDLSTDSAARLAASTWPHDIRPLAHYSSSRTVNEDATAAKISHADHLYEKMPAISSIFDIEIEAKAKDLALLKYREVWS